MNRKIDNKKNLEKHFIKNLAYQYSKTLSIEEAANKIDLDQLKAVELAAKPEFRSVLAEISPELIKAWDEGKAEDSIGIHVRSLAKKDGEKFYKMMVRDLEELSEKDRIPLLEKLLRLGGYFDKEESREILTLAPSVVAEMRKTAEEMDTPIEKIPGAYDA